MHSDGLRLKYAHFGHVVALAVRHHRNFIALLHSPVYYPNKTHRAFVVIVIRIENQSLERLALVARRRRDLFCDRRKHRVDIDTLFGGNTRRVLCGKSDNILDFSFYFVRSRCGKIYFIDDGDYLEITVEREIYVCKRLRFHALRGVDNENSSFARRKRA